MKGELAIFLVKFGWNYGGEILTSRNGWSLFVRSEYHPALIAPIEVDIDIEVNQLDL